MVPLGKQQHFGCCTWIVHCIHVAVQENNLPLKLFAWEYFLPLYFITNETNYARYGFYYVEQLKSIDTTFPGLKEVLKHKDFSGQAQEKYPVRIAVDQRGEQTIKKQVKTAGGIKHFSSNPDSVRKWCLNRAEQAHSTKALTDLCDIGADPEFYKPFRPSQIRKSEELVTTVVRVLEEEYINPFVVDIGDQLINLSSGVSLNDEITEDLLSFEQRGKQKHKLFVDERLKVKEKTFPRPT